MLKFKRISPPSDPAKEGYTFKGWTPSIPQRMPWKSVTVKAQWQVNEHNVKWIIDEETILTQTLAYGTKITAPDAPERSGYTLSPWSIHPETMPDEDLTISATYIKDTDVIVAANEEQFTNEVMELVNNGLSSPDLDPQEALEDESTLRYI